MATQEERLAAREPTPSEQNNASYLIFPTGAIGVYAQDEKGNPWTAFEIMNGTAICDVCGSTINRGYVRGKWGEKQLHVCCEHVRWEGLPEIPKHAE